jgi:hypothetical protein
VDERRTAFCAVDDMHQVEAQRLRHGKDSISGLQPFITGGTVPRPPCGRPRQKCRWAFGPLSPVVQTVSQHRHRNRGQNG